jgi:hypothetical protein
MWNAHLGSAGWNELLVVLCGRLPVVYVQTATKVAI